jgi:uncharacterized protein
MDAVEMQVEQVTLDPVLGAPVVILREKRGDRTVPIWIGQGEAAAIVSELRCVPMARPSSHDLMKELIFRLRASVSHVRVTDLQKGTFFAEVALATPEGSVCVDSRPSDAIALALRAGSPIFVEHEVVDRAWGLVGAVDSVDLDFEEKPIVMLEAPMDCCDGLLEALNDDDFGKWKM